MSLSDYTDEQLRAELARRADLIPKEVRPKKFCEDCAHFRFWKSSRPCPESYNPCAMRHEMKFAMPIGYDFENAGHYKTGCKDRTERHEDDETQS